MTLRDIIESSCSQIAYHIFSTLYEVFEGMVFNRFELYLCHGQVESFPIRCYERIVTRYFPFIIDSENPGFRLLSKVTVCALTKYTESGGKVLDP